MSHIRNLGLMLVMGTSAAHSYDFNYHSIELDYLNAQVEDVATTGFQLKNTQRLNDTMTYSLGLSDVSDENQLKTSGYSLGLGYHMPITTLTDMVMGMTVSRLQTSGANIPSSTDTGRAIEFGLRHQLSRKLEFDFSVVSSNEFGQSNTGLDMGFISKVGQDVSVRGGYQKNEHGDTFSIGLRLDL